MKLKKLNSKLLVLAAIGGADDKQSEAFAIVSSNDQSRLSFVFNVLAFVQDNFLDGIDIDWEFPTADKNNFVLMLQDLAKVFLPHKYILSIAVGPDKWRSDAFYDIPKISQVVDFINLMTYDFRGSWDDTVGQHAQLFPHQNDSSYRREINCAASVTFWLSNGASADKLVLGIPTYGNIFVLANAKEHKIGSQVNIYETKKARTNMGYNEYCAVKDIGWKQYFDNNYRVYYAVFGYFWFGFENVQQVVKKTKYVKNRQLGGVMFWSLDTDDINNNCKSGRFPLILSAFREINKT